MRHENFQDVGGPTEDGCFLNTVLAALHGVYSEVKSRMNIDDLHRANHAPYGH